MTAETYDADVIVIGCGAMGACSLWQLARRGARVIGFEQFEPGHGRGSSHGESRIIRSAISEGGFYVPLVQRAFELWRELEAESRMELLLITGCLLVGHPDSDLVAGSRRSAREHGLSQQLLSADEMSMRFPQHRLHQGEIGLFEQQGGVLRPEAAVKAAAAAAVAQGADIRRQTRVESVSIGPRGVDIQAGGRRYSARRAVVAAGSWLGRLLPDLQLPVTVERIVQHWFPSRHPELFGPDSFPPFIRQRRGGDWFGLPRLERNEVKVAIHHGGRAADPDALASEVDEDDVRPVAELVRAWLPDLEPAPVRSQVCMYTNTPDLNFLVGITPGKESVVVLGGFSGHGFKFAPVIGEVAADLSLEGSTRHPIGPLAVDRFAAKVLGDGGP